MAASCMTAVRTSLTGVHLVSCRLLLGQRVQTPTVCHRLRFHVSPCARLWSSRTEPQGTDRTQSSAGGGRAEQDLKAPEYIPRRKAKSPMRMVTYAWMIGLPMSLVSFLLVKRHVDKNRLKHLKIRQRMKRANDGNYEGSRYLKHKRSVELD